MRFIGNVRYLGRRFFVMLYDRQRGSELQRVICIRVKETDYAQIVLKVENGHALYEPAVCKTAIAKLMKAGLPNKPGAMEESEAERIICRMMAFAMGYITPDEIRIFAMKVKIDIKR